MIERMETFSPKETFQFAKELGQKARSKEVYILSGDLGCGKTIISQGFGKGLAIDEPIVSPTFTILQEYTSGRLPLYHMDVYRIVDVDEMEEIGYDDIFYGEGVCLIEWGELIEEILPKEYTQIKIEKDLIRGEDYRLITIERKSQ